MREVTETWVREQLATRHGAPRVVAGGNAAVPWQLLQLVDQAVPRYHLFMLNAPVGIPLREGITPETPFVGPGMRGAPSLRYIPARLSQVPTLLTTTCVPDIVCLHTSAPRDGKVSLGVEVNILPAAVEACRARGGLVLAQVNPAMPYTFGDGELDVACLDAVLTAEHPLGPVVAAPPGGGHTPRDDTPRDTGASAARRIGEQVAGRISDGSTLQLGIGQVPDSVLAALCDRRRLGIWSEMVSDGLLDLDESGALDPDRPVVASFVMGSPRLYAWLDGNPRARILRTETTNDPARIALNPAMTSINTALQVDLFGQANASRIRARIHSGFGGQTDFVVGALHSRGGQAFMALRSWHPRADVSTIVPLVDEPVTSFQHTAVVTEQGLAEVFGHDQRSQARHLIECAAHPSVRAELREEARALGLA